LIVVAHGESWEVAASHAVSNLVKKIVEEQNNGKEQPQENGTFALQYTPADQPAKSITVPISSPNTLPHSRSSHSLENGGLQHTNPNGTLCF
jgi:hypothetical protein